jgi:riboflavin kinase/FMN adenylyltransferase
MKVIYSLDKKLHLKPPISLTIGMFDGVHKGHQYLISEVKQFGFATLLTFSNHPLSILNPTLTPTPILSLEQKLNLLEFYGVETVIVLAFTKELSQTPYDIFLKHLHEKVGFNFLVLGKGATLGQKGEGHEARVKQMAPLLGFEAVYISKQSFEGEAISSRRIREMIRSNQFEKAVQLLGHSQTLNN